MKATNLNHKTSYIISLQNIKVLKLTTCTFMTKLDLYIPPFKNVHHNNKLAKEAQSQFI
jgi:hypothetical protein